MTKGDYVMVLQAYFLSNFDRVDGQVNQVIVQPEIYCAGETWDAADIELESAGRTRAVTHSTMLQEEI